MKTSYLCSFLVFILYALNACQSGRHVADLVNGQWMPNSERSGGFYLLDKIPEQRLSELGINKSTVQKAASYFGIFYLTKKSTPTPQQLKYWHDRRCGDERARFIDSAYCRANESAVCGEKCEFIVSRFECSGVRWRNLFITSRHCLPNKAEDISEPKAKFFMPDGSLKSYDLEVIPNTYHEMPYDVVAFRLKEFVSEKGDDLELAGLEAQEIGAPVFGLGLPVLFLRQDRAASYDYPIFPFGLRITMGRIVDPNHARMSYCAYTNDDDVTNIEAWKLQADCSRFEYNQLKYKGSEQRDPFLTDTDMTYGMSGSPLFNKEGQWIGIGSNALSNDPKYYQPGKWAIYVKAQNIVQILGRLPREDQ